jgi:ribosomal protein S18 acetylase RimI-like enzyme
VSFRRAETDDIDALVALIESAYRGDASRDGWTTEADLLGGRRTDRDTVAAVIAAPASRMVVESLDGDTLGCAQLERRGDEAYFGMFAISPTSQGAGLGSALLVEAERIARDEWGARQMQMTVIRQREDLIAWYGRRGYRATGETRPFPYGDERFGLPRVADLEFVVLAKQL